MTVPSGSEDTTSSDDVYSSVPDTSSDNMDAIHEKGTRYQKGDKLGPLPAVPQNHHNTAKQTKHKNNVEMDENNNGPHKGTKYNIHDGKETKEQILFYPIKHSMLKDFHYNSFYCLYLQIPHSF